MRHADPIPLAGLDDNCAVHQFIRVYGRRPTRAELARCQRLAAAADVSSSVAGTTSLPAGITGLVRREVARFLARF